MFKINPKYITIITSIFFLGVLVYFLNDLVAYLLIGWVISMIGAPVMSFLIPHIGRSGAAFLTLSIFFIITISLTWFLVPPFVNQVQTLANIDQNKIRKTLEEPLKDWEEWLITNKLYLPSKESQDFQKKIESPQTLVHQIVLDSLKTIDKSGSERDLLINVYLPNNVISKTEYTERNFFSFARSQLTNYLSPQYIQKLVNSILNNLSEIFIALFSIFFISFFFLKEQGLFINMIKAGVPAVYEAQTEKVINETSKLLIQYFVGIFFQVLLITLLISLPLLILGIKNALLIGVLAGMLNIIPYLGPLVALFLAVFITIGSNMDGSFYNELVPTLLKLGIVFVIVRIIDDFIIQPSMFSKRVKAHPLEIFLIVMVGAKLGGILGTLLAIPLYTAIRVFGKNFLSEFKIVQLLTKNLQ
jgi:predicted PurR-regulated permease PerM